MDKTIHSMKAAIAAAIGLLTGLWAAAFSTMLPSSVTMYHTSTTGHTSPAYSTGNAFGKKANAQLDDPTANKGGKFNKFARDLDALGNFYNGRKNGYDSVPLDGLAPQIVLARPHRGRASRVPLHGMHIPAGHLHHQPGVPRAFRVPEKDLVARLRRDSYRPTIRKLMERGALTGRSDPDPDSLEDNVLNVSEEYCRAPVIA